MGDHSLFPQKGTQEYVRIIPRIFEISICPFCHFAGIKIKKLLSHNLYCFAALCKFRCLEEKFSLIFF